MAKFKLNPLPEWEDAMRGKGSSSATEPHADRRTRRQRSRADAKRSAIKSDGN